MLREKLAEDIRNTSICKLGSNALTKRLKNKINNLLAGQNGKSALDSAILSDNSLQGMLSAADKSFSGNPKLIKNIGHGAENFADLTVGKGGLSVTKTPTGAMPLDQYAEYQRKMHSGRLVAQNTPGTGGFSRRIMFNPSSGISVDRYLTGQELDLVKDISMKKGPSFLDMLLGRPQAKKYVEHTPEQLRYMQVMQKQLGPISDTVGHNRIMSPTGPVIYDMLAAKSLIQSMAPSTGQGFFRSLLDSISSGKKFDTYAAKMRTDPEFVRNARRQYSIAAYRNRANNPASWVSNM